MKVVYPSALQHQNTPIINYAVSFSNRKASVGLTLGLIAYTYQYYF